LLKSESKSKKNSNYAADPEFDKPVKSSTREMHIGTSGYFGMADAGTDTRPKYEPR